MCEKCDKVNKVALELSTHAVKLITGDPDDNSERMVTPEEKAMILAASMRACAGLAKCLNANPVGVAAAFQEALAEVSPEFHALASKAGATRMHGNEPAHESVGFLAGIGPKNKLEIN